MPQVQLLAEAALVALVVCAGSLIALHILPTGANPLRDPLSRYGHGRYRMLYDWQAFAAAVAAGGLAWSFLSLRLSVPLWGSAGLAVYAVASLLIGSFPPDMAPPPTRRGRFNTLLAWLALAGMALAAASLTGPLIRLGANPQLAVAAGLILLAAAGRVAAEFVQPLRAIVGLLERALCLGTVAWLGLIVAQLLRVV